MPRYKWLEYKDFSGNFCDALDDVPHGWKIAFGDQMVDELDEILEKYNFTDEYEIAQIKEKYGSLRWYDNGFPHEGFKEYNAWLDKYEKLSSETCIECGAPGKMRMVGWICPYCDEHARGAMSIEEYVAKRAAENPRKPYVEKDDES